MVWAKESGKEEKRSFEESVKDSGKLERALEDMIYYFLKAQL